MFTVNGNNILLGSVRQVVKRRFVVGESVDTSMVVLINNLFKSLSFAINQFENGEISYYQKIVSLKKLIFNLKYSCPIICNYRDFENFGDWMDFRADNVTVTADNVTHRVSQLQIPI